MNDAPKKLRELSLWQVIALYIGAGWAVLQAADLFIDRLGFPTWLFEGALILLLIGLPILIATAVLQQSKGSSQRQSVARTTGVRDLLTWRNAAIAGVLAFALLGAASVTVRAIGAIGGGSEKWARTTGMAELTRAVDAADWPSAWSLLSRLAEPLAGDSTFQQVRAAAATRVSVRTRPEGATVYHRFYGASDTTWRALGKTPLDSIWFP